MTKWADEREAPHVQRAQAARRTISERFLAAASQEAKPPWQGMLGLPAFLSLNSIRPTRDGSIAFTLVVPSEHMAETLPALVGMGGRPLAVTMEIIDTDNIEPFDA